MLRPIPLHVNSRLKQSNSAGDSHRNSADELCNAELSGALLDRKFSPRTRSGIPISQLACWSMIWGA